MHPRIVRGIRKETLYILVACFLRDESVAIDYTRGEM